MPLDKQLAPLMGAFSEPKIVEAVAHGAWKKDKRPGEPEIPTGDELAEWAPEAPEGARRESEDRLRQLNWSFRCAPVPYPVLLIEGETRRWRRMTSCPLVVGKPATIGFRPGYHGLRDHEILCAVAVWPERAGLVLDTCRPLPSVHIEWCLWRRAGRPLQHPLTPILRAYWDRPRLVARNPRPDPLFPKLAIPPRPDDPQGQLFSPRLGTEHPSGQLDLWPGHGPGHAGGPIKPAPLLAIYDAGHEAADSRNPAAPLASRIWLEGVLDVRLEDRGHGPVRLPPITTRELLQRLYPAHPGRRSPVKWRPEIQLPALLESLDLVDRHRIPILDHEGRRTYWRIVSVTGRPGEHPDDALHLVVDMPPGSERGPVVDRQAVRIAGARSGAAWRLALSLAFLWHDPGRLRLPVGGGRTWRQIRQPDRYPEVSDAELLSLAFPAGHPGRQRDARGRAEKALDYLVQIGYAARHPRRRIMPGTTWAGWERGRGAGIETRDSR